MKCTDTNVLAIEELEPGTLRTRHRPRKQHSIQPSYELDRSEHDTGLSYLKIAQKFCELFMFPLSLNPF